MMESNVSVSCGVVGLEDIPAGVDGLIDTGDSHPVIVVI